MTCDHPHDGKHKKCADCREEWARKMREYRARDPEKHTAYQKAWKRKRRETVLFHYGGVCACCAEDRYEFLAIDHINGGGEQHRKQIKAEGNGMVDWLIQNDLPEGYRVLCHNCNMALGFYGRCPHEQE